MTCTKQLYISALRTGFEDIQAALENVSSPVRWDFVDVLEKIHRSFGEVGDSTVEHMVLTVGLIDAQSLRHNARILLGVIKLKIEF